MYPCYENLLLQSCDLEWRKWLEWWRIRKKRHWEEV